MGQIQYQSDYGKCTKVKYKYKNIGYMKITSQHNIRIIALSLSTEQLDTKVLIKGYNKIMPNF